MSETGEREAALSTIETLTRRSNELIVRIERDRTDEERVRKPSPTAWSLTEVVQHISLVGAGMLATARPAVRGIPFGGWAKSALLRGVLRSRMKIRAPVAAIIPQPGITWNDARANLVQSNGRWSEFIEGATFNETGFRHPFVGALRPTETAAFLVEHFNHHMRQVDRLFSGFKASRS